MNEAVQLLSVTSQLISCMEQEVALLQAHEPQNVERLQNQKSAFANSYKAWANAMKKGDQIHLDPQLKHELMEATARCEAAIQHNMRALKAMRDISEKVLQAIVSSIEEERTHVASYDRSGTTKRSRINGQTARA